MAEATLDANQQALAPTTGGQVAARPATPAATNTSGALAEKDDVDRLDDIENDTGPLAFLNNPDVQRVLPYIIGTIALAICVLFYLLN